MNETYVYLITEREVVTMDFIKRMNDMFAENPYTDNGRVKVSYDDVCNVVVVKVLNDVETIDASEHTYYGLMYAIMGKVEELYGYF